MADNTGINAWEQDPGSGAEPGGGALLQRPVPQTGANPFPTSITGSAAPVDNYSPGTVGFRYWAAADALRRASDFWGSLLGNHAWNKAIKDSVLPVILDEGVDLNAYYDRQALNFFHASVGGRMVYSGESPDIVCHEFGHAILDAIRPQLWDVAALEPPAFHESFGDISALLTALQLPSVQIGVLQETNGQPYRSSRLSRLAEQLGWAIRQVQPDAVEPDCLRNAVNSLFYANPDDLPTSATASELSSEPHSFSRVFTGAVFESLALMYMSQPNPTQATLQQVSVDLATVLLGAIRQAPVVPEYFAQVGSHMVALAVAKSQAHGDAVKTAMTKHGILSVPGAVEAATSSTATLLESKVGIVTNAAPALPLTEVDVSQYGLTVPKVQMVAASEPKRFAIAGAAPSAGDLGSVKSDKAALNFFEDLIRRGRLESGGFFKAQAAIVNTVTLKTHRLVQEGGQVVLRRIRIDCGLRGHSTGGTSGKKAP